MQIHLIRHGEVENPHNVVYADMPGFGLSRTGRQQATTAGEYLQHSPVARIVTSPLDRAVETAELIAAATGADIATDVRLTEWRLSVRWRGAIWSELPVVFPGELEAYLHDPHRLPFTPESLDRVAERVTAAVSEWSTGSHGDIAFVSHQDPIHAGYLRLVAATPPDFHAGKPNHCTIMSLRRTGEAWQRMGRWDPGQSTDPIN